MLPRFGFAVDAGARTRLFAGVEPGSSVDQESRVELESGEIVLSEPRAVAMTPTGEPVPDRSYRLQVGGEQVLSDRSSVEVMAFFDTVSGHGLGLLAIPVERSGSDPRLLSERIADLRARGEQPGTARLERYPLDTYIYGHARTINWEKWPGGTALYGLLFAVLGARVDRIPRVSFLEEPALVVIAGTVAIQTGTLLLLAWPPSRRKPRS